MSLAIDPEDVTHVLLPDGWHHVQPGTFILDSFEFVDGADDSVGGILLGGGREPLVAALGYEFQERGASEGTTLAGPINRLYAVRRPAD